MTYEEVQAIQEKIAEYAQLVYQNTEREALLALVADLAKQVPTTPSTPVAPAATVEAEDDNFGGVQ